MIALLTACLFFEILVHMLNCISESARLKTVFGHLNIRSSKQNLCIFIKQGYAGLDSFPIS